MPTSSLARRSLEQRLGALRHNPNLARPPQGWIKAIREALGMTTSQLAVRLGISQSRASRIQRDEAAEAITLHKLRDVAEALDCTLVYALIPNRPLDEVLLKRAREIAEKALVRVDHTMALENQSLTADRLTAERQRLIESLLAGPPKQLWEKQ
ncbi:MAG: mobile mystery protein A [Hyphomonadaceae bacterium]|nr:mobile mystery protein A [Hyphomonadaceae bacterium]